MYSDQFVCLLDSCQHFSNSHGRIFVNVWKGWALGVETEMVICRDLFMVVCHFPRAPLCFVSIHGVG